MRSTSAATSRINFVKGTFDELYVVYNEFKSAIQQRVIVEKLFPVDAAEWSSARRTAGGRPAAVTCMSRMKLNC